MHELHDSPAIDAIYNQLVRDQVTLLSVASATEQCGNTLISLALAKRLAQADKQVLLIEFNSQAPSLHWHTQTKQSHWLPSDGQWLDALEKTDQPRLMVLNAPLCQSDQLDSIEFRNAELLGQFFQQTLSQFDLVVCDTPALLNPKEGLTCGVTIASVCDGCLLNVLSSVTNESQIDEVKRLLKQAKVTLFGAVMNDRYCPSLQQEILRELKRFERFMPRLCNWLQRKVLASQLINQAL